MLCSCSALPRPGSDLHKRVNSGLEAKALLTQAAKASGDPWQRCQRVEMQLSGEWCGIVERLQPGLVDSGFRKRSTEVYEPQLGRVTQRHTGPLGTKEVIRRGREIVVRVNGERVEDAEKKASAALVADAYGLFGFGASWLLANGDDFQVIGNKRFADEPCCLISTELMPGFGESEKDWVIAWIGVHTKRLHRVQMTLFGLDSTAGADVDVVFGEWFSGPHGTQWAGHYVEHVQRPILTKAHEWRLEALQVQLNKEAVPGDRAKR